MKRLTSSNFGDICRASSDNTKSNLVKQLIYKNEGRFVPKPIQYGLENESRAIELYSQSGGSCESIWFRYIKYLSFHWM